ncbi:tetraacyldisaccharide 4'-kinase [Deferribacterales bacterium RsTz2092]|nr:tetraacyldisaccharide 4'-kinase [Deferribacterales bacterium]
MTKVISVGNIAMGGTGKSPFTIFLANKYISLGKRVAVLSRGYKGKIGYDTHIISDGTGVEYLTPPLAADEPYMIAKSVPKAVVITGKDRNKSFQLALERYNTDIFILDDGFQHKKMHRDADIVLLDYNNPISTGFPFPFGYLREFPSGLKRADIIVFTKTKHAVLPEQAVRHCAGKPVFFVDFIYKSFSGELGNSAYLMSGIAHNEQFAKQIGAKGIKVLGHSRYQDHHHYTEKEILATINAAKLAGADNIITTHKDYVKLPQELASHFIYPVLDVEVLNGAETLLFETIQKKLY